MEYIKKEELIIGEIYKSTLYNHIFKYLDKNGDKNLNISKTYNVFNKDLATIGHGLNKVINATSEEKHWLNEAIKLDKFITFEEAMKTFILEYVECTASSTSDFTKNKIYKIKNFDNIRNFNILDNDNDLRRVIMNGILWSFKPSTKEAYDAQFVVKEPEFIEYPIDTKVLNTQTDSVYIKKEDGWYKTSDKTSYTDEMITKSNHINIVEEIKIIEPLPQFKVIETIETITKVENNEGNQFFIGDIVKSLDSDQKGTIIKFRYSTDKSNIIAITTFQSNNGIGIDKIEHYIEPKVEFILPEKWFIKSTEETFNTIRNWAAKKLNCPSYKDYYHYPYVNFNYLGKYREKRYCTEITFDQFKKYVLKEEELSPIQLANIEHPELAIVEETLLNKAKRLYPVGTKFKVACNPIYIATVKDHNDYEYQDVDIINLNTEETIDGCTGMTVFYKGKWAEIINE